MPTFADISGSFGGANVDEDSWVEQLKNVPWNRRRRRSTPHTKGLQKKSEEEQTSDARIQKEVETKPQLAFVGDDTWVDLFPTQFDACHPHHLRLVQEKCTGVNFGEKAILCFSS